MKPSKLSSLISFTTCSTIFGLVYVNQVLASPSSPSSYQKTCISMNVVGATLVASCKTNSGSYLYSTIKIRGIWNNEGVLWYTQDATKASSYQDSCSNIRLASDGVTLSATCLTSNGFPNNSPKILIRGIWNNNGRLTYSN